MTEQDKMPSGKDVESALRAATDGPAQNADEPRSDGGLGPTEEGSALGTEGLAGKSDDPQERRPSASKEDEIRVCYFGQTDVGLVRDHNEDNFIVADLKTEEQGADQPKTVTVEGLGVLLGVCDGMGGAAAGEVASQMAVDTLYEVMVSFKETTQNRDTFARRLVCAIEEAGQRIFERANHDRSQRGMGTTATVAALMDQVLFVGQVGDSRAYLLRNDELTLITKDQSLVNQLIEAGQLTEEEAEAFEHSNIILQALGTTEDVVVDLTFLELRRGDRLMLCSDGLSGLVHQDMIREVLSNTKSIALCAARLIEMAREGGGHDNITCLCADFDGLGLREDTGDAAVFYQQYPLPPDDGETIELPPRPAPPTPVPQPIVRSERQASSGGSWVPWAIVFLIAVAGAFVLFSLTQPEPEPVSPPSVEKETELIAIDVTTDFDGEIYIDGEFRYALKAGESTRIKVMPGSRFLEAKSDGETVAAVTVEAEPGDPYQVQLLLPAGSEAPDGGTDADL